MAGTVDRRGMMRLMVLGGLGLGLGGCESLQDIPHMFERRTPPLPGQREPVFPGGVPGIDRTIPQPANSPLDQPAPAPAEPAPPARTR
jgi:hypothetical protein